MSSLVEEVLGNVANKSPGCLTWFDRLPAEAQAELEAVRETFNPTVHQKRAFARALISAAERRGWKVAKEKQVIAWLSHER